MDEEDTEALRDDDRNSTREPREDDRNEELDDSPAPNPDGENTEDEDTAAI